MTTAPQVALRPLAPQDLPAAARLHRRSFADQPWDERALGELLDSPGVAGLVLVAPTGALEAFVLLRAVGEEAEVLTICVAPESRRAGLGRALLEAGLSLLVEGGVARVFLEVAEDNAGAIALYRALGFQTIATRQDYYSRGPAKVSALVMQRILAPSSSENGGKSSAGATFE